MRRLFGASTGIETSEPGGCGTCYFGNGEGGCVPFDNPGSSEVPELLGAFPHDGSGNFEQEMPGCPSDAVYGRTSRGGVSLREGGKNGRVIIAHTPSDP